MHTDLTPWNEPYIASEEDGARNAYLTRGWDAVNAKTSLLVPGLEGFPSFSAVPGSQLRVFDYPACDDPQPVLQFSAEPWDLLGLGSLRKLPDELRLGREPIESERLIELWTETLTDIVTFSNMNGHPLVYGCGNRGVILNTQVPTFGETYTTRLRDGSDVSPNGIWIDREFDNPVWGVMHEYLFLIEQDDPYRNVVAANIDKCSIEDGLAYAATLDAFESAGVRTN